MGILEGTNLLKYQEGTSPMGILEGTNPMRSTRRNQPYVNKEGTNLLRIPRRNKFSKYITTLISCCLDGAP